MRKMIENMFIDNVFHSYLKTSIYQLITIFLQQQYTQLSSSSDKYTVIPKLMIRPYFGDIDANYPRTLKHWPIAI